MARGVGSVVVKILGDATSFKKAVGEVDATSTRLDSKFKKVAAATTSVLGGIGVTALAKTALDAAASEDQQMTTLAQTLRKTTGARQADIDSVEEWITKTQNATGVADDQLRPALGKLLIAGRSLAQAQRDIAIAADIAAARHLNLETVVNAMSKAAQGNIGSLGRLGIATKDASGKTLTYDQILQEASKTMGGAASAAADTAAGRAQILKLRFQDLQENIGRALIPIMEKLTTVLTAVTAWFNNLSPGMQKVVLIVGGLLVVLGPLVTLVSSVTAAVTGLGAAFAFLAANPIILAVAAVVALGAAIFVAYKKCETFRKIVDRIVDVFQQNWGVILAPLTFGLSLLIQHFSTVRNIIESVINWLKKIPQYVEKALGPIGKIIGKVGGIVGKVGGVVGKIPGFDSGGVVPGPRGAPRLILAHGGETVLPTHRGGFGGKVELHMHAVEGASLAENADYASRTVGWRLGLVGGD